MIRKSLLLVLLLAAATVCHAQEKARQLVDIGQMYYNQKQYDEAKTHLTNTVLKDEAVLADTSFLKEAHALLDSVLTRLNEQQALEDSSRAWIFAARKDSAEGRPAAACNTLERAMTVAPHDTEVTKQARDLFLKQQCEVSDTVLAKRRYEPVWTFLGDVGVGLLLFALLYVILRIFRWVYKKLFRNRWVLENMEDSSGLGLGDEVTSTLFSWFHRRPSVSSGLLRLEPLSRRGVFELDISGPKLDLDLGSLPPLGGIQVGTIVKIIKAIGAWITGRRPWILGTVLSTDSIVKVVLSSRNGEGIPHTTTASCDKTATPQQLTSTIESATFKMYYLIANDTSVAEAESTDALRIGARHLRAYIAGRDHQQLKDAYDTFRSVRKARPEFPRVYLYEGVALDLMEKHDEAIRLFASARELEKCTSGTEMSELCQEAIYNEAVAKFRKYRPEPLKEAIALLNDNLLGAHKKGSKLYYYARIAQVTFVAHQLIFWQRLLHGDKSKDEDEERDRREASKNIAWEWVTGVEKETWELEKAIEEGKAGSDTSTLHWSIWNALGNAYLNFAFAFEEEPSKDLLNKALVLFKKCQTLFANIVETLANLATTYSFLGEYQTCRDYCDQVLKVNPDYEYAAYRKCQSWLMEEKYDELKECLRDFEQAFGREPSIGSFKAIYDKYHE